MSVISGWTHTRSKGKTDKTPSQGLFSQFRWNTLNFWNLCIVCDQIRMLSDSTTTVNDKVTVNSGVPLTKIQAVKSMNSSKMEKGNETYVRIFFFHKAPQCSWYINHIRQKFNVEIITYDVEHTKHAQVRAGACTWRVCVATIWLLFVVFCGRI